MDNTLRHAGESQTPRRAPDYRPDIDGLRAIAVLAVVLYHARVPGFGGGYVGVDVFFVISGYLITQLLVRADSKSLRLTLAEFYLRRGRRILPALIVASAVATVGACVLLMPWDLKRFGKYLAATPVLLSNIPAWREGAGYFASSNKYVALNHFWSIAVEEQFYLLYPLTLFAIGRWLPRYRSAALSVLAGLSLAVCIWGSYYRPTANFFLAPPRAWELLLGATLAALQVRGIRNRIANEWLAGLSLAALALIVYAYSWTMSYPGLYTIAPCAAAALIIVTGAQHPTQVRRLLSARPLVFTGLISYSLYLWHLPVLLLFAYFNILPLSAVQLGVLLAAVYLLAAASWKFIERPVRARRVLKSSRAFVLAALTANIVVLTTGLLLWNSDGFPRRFPTEAHLPDQDWLIRSDAAFRCINRPIQAIASVDICSYGPQNASVPAALVWGDSHAMALMPAYDQLGASLQVRVYFAGHGACRPLLGVSNGTYSAASQDDCLKFNAAMAQAVQRLKPRLVILNAHWIDADTDLVWAAGAHGAAGESNFRRALEATVQLVRSNGGSVCAVLDDPTYAYDVTYAVGMARRRGISEDFLKVSRADALEEFRDAERDFRTLEREGRLRTVDLKDVLCRGDSCVYDAGGHLLYGDTNHLSDRGALFVASTVARCFQDLPPTAKR